MESFNGIIDFTNSYNNSLLETAPAFVAVSENVSIFLQTCPSRFSHYYLKVFRFEA